MIGPGGAKRRAASASENALGLPSGNPRQMQGEARMIGQKQICVVLPAYNAGRTLERTLRKSRKTLWTTSF